MGFESIAHTADIGLRVWGRTLEELFSEAAVGMMSLMADTAGVEKRQTRVAQADGPDNESLLVAWLNDILFLVESERFIFAQVRIETLGGGVVRGVLAGTTVGADFRFAHQIKAATYHDIEVKKTPKGFETVVIFDV